MTAALYARVSTRKLQDTMKDIEPAWKQDPEVQLLPLRQLAKSRGWQAVEYVDRFSGAIESRPDLDRLMEDVRRHRIKVVVVWKFDRFARTTRQLINVMEEFRVLGVDFISHTEAVDTTTPMGRAMFGMLAVFAELERETIRERIKAGIDKRRRQGKTVGRQRVVFDREKLVELYASGLSVSQVAAAMQLRRSTAGKYLQVLKAGEKRVLTGSQLQG